MRANLKNKNTNLNYNNMKLNYKNTNLKNKNTNLKTGQEFKRPVFGAPFELGFIGDLG